MTRQLDFSALPCRTCGWRHQLDAFEPGQRVRVLADVRGGEVGVVTEWSQYGGPVYVRVQFADGLRDNFAPCQLEHAPNALAVLEQLDMTAPPVPLTAEQHRELMRDTAERNERWARDRRRRKRP